MRVLGLGSGHFRAVPRPEALCFGAFCRLGPGKGQGGGSAQGLNRMGAGIGGDQAKLESIEGLVSAVLQNFLELPHAAQQALEGELPHEADLREAYAEFYEALAERVRAAAGGEADEAPAAPRLLHIAASRIRR
jgi:hypothetical protein